MEQLDSTIVNTSIPAMAASLGVTPLSLKAVATSYIVSLAVCIPVSGWLAERFGSRRVFLFAVSLFTLSSVLCGLAMNAQMLIAARIPQGIAAAMMMPVGRIAIIRTFPKSELLGAMNFVIIPALIGPLLGPTVGGLVVHWLSWRDIFFINVPVGVLALWLAWRHMPDYRSDTAQPLDLRGLLLFGGGTALLSWVLEVFGEHGLTARQALWPVLLSVALLAAYGWHARRVPFPLLRQLAAVLEHELDGLRRHRRRRHRDGEQHGQHDAATVDELRPGLRLAADRVLPRQPAAIRRGGAGVGPARRLHDAGAADAGVVAVVLAPARRRRREHQQGRAGSRCVAPGGPAAGRRGSSRRACRQPASWRGPQEPDACIPICRSTARSMN
jgi:hypothetical protein